MRHNVYGRHLGRTKNQRTSLFRNLVGALILNGSIETTEAKAKAIKGLVDKIINQAKNKNSQRLVSQFLVHQNIQEKLFKEIIPATKDRNSGFTSIVKLGQRLGDNTMKVRMSLLMETPAGNRRSLDISSSSKSLRSEDVRNAIAPSSASSVTKKVKSEEVTKK